MPQPSDIAAYVASRPWLHAVVVAVAYPLVWLRRRALRRKHELYERAVAFPKYGEVAVPVAGLDATFLVDIRSDILRRIVFTGSYEPDAIDAVRRNVHGRGDVVDIGANVGIFTVLMARLVGGDGRVLAVEPTPAAARRLRHNVAANAVTDRVIVEECAMGAKPGSIRMSTVVGMEEYSRVGELVLPDTAGRESQHLDVPLQTIDGLVVRHGLKPVFIKMDIEGSEMSALAGASTTLARFRPTILAEVDDRMLHQAGTSAASMIVFLESHGYRVTRVDGSALTTRENFVGDVLAVHHEGPARP